MTLKPDKPPLKCPICKKSAAAMSADPAIKSPFPFCSDRCRLIDLGRWFDGAYQVPSDDDDLDESNVRPLEDD